MITYLWTRNDGTYVGLNGHVYNEAPTTDEIIELQQYAQGFVNDQYAYGQAFATNVADKIGVERDQYLAYYNTDDSCLPDICKVTANLAEDPSNPEPHVKSEIYTADTGCRVLDFTFYNIKGECECTIESSQIYVRYSRSDCFPDECMFPVPDGCDYMGLLITNNEEDSAIFSKYSWFKIGGLGDNATSYISYVFARSPRKPVTPSGGTYTTGLPTAPSGIWYDTVPGHNNYGIWMSKRVFWSDEITPENPSGKIEHTDLAWSDPVLMTDNKTFQSEWAAESNETNQVYINQNDPAHGPTLPSLNEARFQDPTNITEGINETLWRQAAAAAGCGNWSDNAAGATYLAWSNCRNGLWDDWTIAKIRGEGGKDGANAGRVFMIFCSLEKEDGNGQMVIPNRPEGGHWDMVNNILETDGNPPLTGTDTLGRSVAWSPDNARQSSDMCTWLSTGSFDGDTGNIIGQWSEPVCITGEDGIDGTDGENREYIYARFATLDDYMCYASGFSQTEDFECGDAYAECQEMLNTTADTAYQENDYIPTNPNWVYATWLDHPEGIEPDWRVEACCMRLKQEVDDPDNPGETISVWGPWIGPFIWASWGEDGIDGDGVEYIFCVTTRADVETAETYVYTQIKAPTEEQMEILNHPDAYPGQVEVVRKRPNGEYPSDSKKYLIYKTSASESYYELVQIVKETYLYPDDLVPPPQNFEENCATESQDGCRWCNDSLYRTLCYGEANYDLKKKILDRYFLLPEFMPGNKVYDDLADPDSELRKIITEEEEKAGASLGGNYDFITAWDGNWTDNPLDVGPQQPYEWVSMRKYKAGTHDTTKEWQPFCEPKLWANWAFDGTSTFTSMIFTRTNDNISGMKLCGGTFEYPFPGAFSDDEPLPEGCEDKYDVYKRRSEVSYKCPDCEEAKKYYWYDTVPSDMDYYYEEISMDDIPDNTTVITAHEWPETVTENSPDYIVYTNPDLSESYFVKKNSPRNSTIWMATRVFGDEITNQTQGWSAPRRMSDTADFNVEWCVDYLTQAQINIIKSDECNFGKFVEQVPEDDDTHTQAEALWEDYLLHYGDTHPEFAENGLGLWSDQGDGAIYMATTTFRNGRWTNWTVSKIKGEKGDAGVGIKLYGSTKGVVKEYSELNTCVKPNMRPAVGDIWCVYDCNSQDIPCLSDDDWHYEVAAGVQFFEYMADGSWDCLACRSVYDYVDSNEAEFSLIAEQDPTQVEVITALPSAVTETSKLMVHVTGTTSNPLDEYYIKQKFRFVEQGITVVLNGINEVSGGCQGNFTADDLAEIPFGKFVGLRNGDFFVWDTDSWLPVTNIMGPGTYVHIKFASAHIGNRYRLTDPITDSTEDANPGETPGKYMGMYVDSIKQDFVPAEADGDGHYYVNDEYSVKPGPYKWVKVEGDDGLGYEYIYVTTLTDNLTDSVYTDGRPFVPYFSQAFMEGELYQQDGFIPKAIVTNQKTGAQVNIRSEFLNNSYCVDWDDNAVTCDEDDRFRWRCYRVRTQGVWGPFIGDKTTKTADLPNGKYSTFDANYSVDGESIVLADFDNETIAIGCTDSGYTAERMTFELVPELYKGSSAYTVTGCTWIEGGDSSWFSTATTNGRLVLRATIPVGAEVYPALNARFEISGYYQDLAEHINVPDSSTAVARIIGIKGNVIYSLVTSKSAIKKDGMGALMDDLPLTCNVLKRVVGTTEYETVSSLSNGDEYRIWYEGIEFNSSDPEASSVRKGWFTNNYYDTRTEQENVKEKVTFSLYTRVDDTTNYWPGQPDGTLVLNDVETVYVVSDGEKGSSPFLADLDNELDSIPLTFEGVVDGDDYDPSSTEATYVETSTRVSLYYGSRDIEIDGVSATTGTTQVDSKVLTSSYKKLDTDGNLFAKIDESNLITFRVKNGWNGFPQDPLEIRIFVEGDYNGEHTLNALTFTMAGVRAGKAGEHATLYSLLPSYNTILRNSNGGKDPTTITCDVLKKSGKNVTTLDVTDLPDEDLKIVYCCDDDLSYSTVYSGALPTNDIDKYIRFALIAKTATTITTNNLYDKETVPVVKDGLDGSSPFILDIDNELDSVPLTYEGVVDAGGDDYVTGRTNVNLFYGSHGVVISGISATTGTTLEGSKTLSNAFVNLDAGGNIQAAVNQSTLTVRVKDGWNGFPQDPLEIRIFGAGTYDGQNTTSRATFTLAGVKAGKQGESATIYSLLPSSSFLVKGSDGNIAPNPLSCTVVKKTGKSVLDLSLNDIAAEGLKIMWSKDDDTSYSNEYVEAIETGEINKAVRFALIPRTATTVANDNLYDRETVPLVKDGAVGRGIVAKCDYWCANACATTSDIGFPPKESIGSSPTGWTRNGTWYYDTDVDFHNPQTSNDAIPIPTEEYPYLWKWEKTWYSDGSAFPSNPALICELGDGIQSIESWYIIMENTEDNKQHILSTYNEIAANRIEPSAGGFTLLATTPPRELTAGTEAGEARWQFDRIIFSQKQPLCLGIEIVQEYYMALKDVEVLRGMFGEANVEGKEGAYLREFLGVMGDWDFKPGGASDTSENFVDRNVKAFLNASTYWAETRDGDYCDPNGQVKGRVMIAAGVTNLGGTRNITTPPFTGTNKDVQVNIENFRATTKIWESGFLECECASIKGRIEATEGWFGGAKNVVIAEDGIVAYPVITLSNGTKAADYTSTPMFVIGETGATFNGTVNANDGTIGCLRIKNDGTIEHTANTSTDIKFKITQYGELTAKYTNTIGSERTTNQLSNSKINYYREQPPYTYECTLDPDGLMVQYVNASHGAASQRTEIKKGYILVSAGTNGFTEIQGGNITASTKIYSYRMEAETGFYQTSDERKKTNIIPLSNVLDTIDTIPTVYYNWKEGDTKERRIGTLAQGVLGTYPELVNGSEETAYTVEYPELSVIAIAAIKELKAEVESLKDEIKRLKEERNG